MSKNKGKAKKKSAKSYSGIDAHKMEKKVLVPPLMAVPGVTLMSWANDRMPEMLWSALLISQLGRDRAHNRFRGAARLVDALPEEKRRVQPTLSGLASLEPAVLQRFLSAICCDTETKKALRPLLLFDTLPARQEWAEVIGEAPSADDWESLKLAVLPVLSHQSQEATDCRWVRVLFQLLSGALFLQSEEQVREILEYPGFGLPEKVRPTVRCMEGMVNGRGGTATSWPMSFWSQCLRDTCCDARHTMEAKWSPHLATTRHRIREVREALARHERSSLATTAVDAKHDAAFGFGAYSLAVLEELLSMGNSTSILGRIGLRTLLESYVTLSYLKVRDDSNLWVAYRQYGAAQAKLAFLKLDDPGGTAPVSIDVEILRELADEDRWLEFVSIDLGHWAAKDLRRLSDEAGVKQDYDRFYPRTSAFTHCNWAAARNSCFDLCINPLHRMHRVLRSDTADLGDVVDDACELVDKILGVVDGLYPGFTARVTLPESRVSIDGAPAARGEQEIANATQLATIQREYFQVLDQFFRMATGVCAEEFAPMDSFGDRVRAEAQKLGGRGPQAYMYAHEAFQAFYKRFGLHIFPGAKNLAGLKLVLGGSSRFGESQFDCVRKMSLYADTILIPDPIFPWIESSRGEERFRNILLLETAFVLLHLKPLLDAELPSPPILVFPSFEKSLEEGDPTTQARISSLITRVLSHYLRRQFANIGELQRFVVSEEAEFMRAVDEHSLFVAPGGVVGQPLKEALERYEEEIKRWRSESYQSAMKELPKGVILLNAIMERLAPQYHLLENAGELSSCPLLPLRAPWHYYSLVSKFFAAQLAASGNLEEKAPDAFDLMNEPQPKWLGNVSVVELVEFLKNGENSAFRTRLKQAVSRLRDAPLSDLSRTAPEVCRDVASLLQGHNTEVESILEKYKTRYGDVGTQHYVTTGASFMPTLAPSVRIPHHPETGQPDPGMQPPPPQKVEVAHSLLGVLAVGDES